MHAQYRVKYREASLGITASSLITYGLGGIPDAHLISDANWGGDFRPERRDWDRSAYLFGGLQLGIAGITALYVPQNQQLDLFLISSHTLSITYLLSQTSKALMPRLRPYAMNGATNNDYNKSFWSGTSALSLALTGLTWRFADAYFPNGKMYVKASSLILGSAVMYSRVKAGQHHTSDVLVGGLVGFCIGYFLPRINRIEYRPTGLVVRF